MSYEEEIKKLVGFLYGKENAALITPRIMDLIETYKIEEEGREELFSEKDVVLITYGDSLKKESEKPLSTLHHFARFYLKDIISTIHILSCFPYSSDDGFSVIDYAAINPGLGSWVEMRKLAGDFKLMLDLVLNHISAQSQWFKKYLAEKNGFKDLAIEVAPSTDITRVPRPRTLPLLTPFQKKNGKKVHLWTTFSADQVDLNYKSIDVLLKMVEVLLFYLRQGVSIIRLDAIAYLWKEIGTNCLHLAQTHTIVKLLRKIFNAVKKDGIILTETIVSHPINVSYFGNGHDEAQMVYNFTLPPLLLYTFMEEDSCVLTRWARTLNTPSLETTFLNFTASHDGIYLPPLEDILPQKEIDEIIERVKMNGGGVSYRRDSDGSERPYELNITYVDALLKKDAHGLDPLHAKRFLASQAIQMVFPGVPAVYIHSLLGSRNWLEGVEQTGRARTINREKLDFDTVVEALRAEHSFRHRVFTGYTRLLKVRRCQPAFHPNASFEIPEVDPRVFLMIRKTKEQTIYAFTNVSAQHLRIGLEDRPLTDLLTGKQLQNDTLELGPYEVVWLASREV